MSSEEIEQQNQKEPQREEIPVPIYFDKYVAGELRSLGNQIVGLKESMDERFVQFDKRFIEIDRRIDEFKESMDERFVQFEKLIDERFIRMDERFVQVDRRFVELKESVDKRFDEIKKRFDKSDATIKWVIGLFSPVIVGILAIIIKMFFGP